MKDESCVDSDYVGLSSSVFLKYRAEVVGEGWEREVVVSEKAVAI